MQRDSRSASAAPTGAIIVSQHKRSSYRRNHCVAAQAQLLQFFDGDVLVREYADIASDIQCFFDNLAGLEVRVLQ